MQRFRQMIEANQFEPLYLTDVCTTVGVAERALHKICTDHVGMSASRYLRLRRMNLARRALRQANPLTATVTGIANDCGFAELGRFAVQYRAMYGESPSATLRRAPD
jgi:AraC-like DNA-binding protein